MENPWKRDVGRCVCRRRWCPLSFTATPCFLLPAVAIYATTGSLVKLVPPLAIYVTSVAKYNFDAWHVVDLWTVAVSTPAMFVLNPVAVVPILCLLWNLVVFLVASHRSCSWHATVHVSTGVAILAWAYDASLTRRSLE